VHGPCARGTAPSAIASACMALAARLLRRLGPGQAKGARAPARELQGSAPRLMTVPYDRQLHGCNLRNIGVWWTVQRELMQRRSLSQVFGGGWRCTGSRSKNKQGRSASVISLRGPHSAHSQALVAVQQAAAIQHRFTAPSLQGRGPCQRSCMSCRSCTLSTWSASRGTQCFYCEG